MLVIAGVMSDCPDEWMQPQTPSLDGAKEVVSFNLLDGAEGEMG